MPRLPGSTPLRTHRASSIRSAIYFKIWGLLFVLSAFSYMVDYFHVQGLLRWSLIIVFMLLKAGLIVAVFMHMMWERLALIYAILVPPLLLIVLLGIGALEADYTWLTRGTFFAAEVQQKAAACPLGRVDAHGAAPATDSGAPAIPRCTPACRCPRAPRSPATSSARRRCLWTHRPAASCGPATGCPPAPAP